VVLTEPEIRSCLKQAGAAFPRFSQWEYNNEINESYPGFSLWGEFVPDPDESMPRIFFVTFDTYQGIWTGHVTIGKPCYYWSSAECGDAHLVDSDPYATLHGAITGLRRSMTDLFTALSGLTADLQ
jgi:hypothetical protein